MNKITGKTYLIEAKEKNCIFQLLREQADGTILAQVFYVEKALSNSIDDIIKSKEEIIIFLLLNGLKRSRLAKIIGTYEIPDGFNVPKFMPDGAVFNRNKWRIVPLDPTQRQFEVELLSDEQRMLSPYQTWSGENLIEKVDAGFK